MLEFFCVILAIWVAVLSILVFIHLDSASSRFFKLEKKQKELDELLSLYKKEGLASSSVQERGAPIASKESSSQEGADSSLMGAQAVPTSSALQKEPPAKEFPSSASAVLPACITPPAQPQQATPQNPQEKPLSSSSLTGRRLFDWENFTVVKLLSWVGGFTLFLGVTFWIKYSIENDLISPGLRVVLSAGLGLILLGVGVFIKKANLKTTADTLSGVGLTVLYASVYSAYGFYHLLEAPAAFALMAVVAVLSFVVAVWKKAKYIGFLAEIISFVTPFLLSVGEDYALFFFSYVAFINIAAAASALMRKWDGLLIGSLVFTFLCQAVIAVTGGLQEGCVTFCVFSMLYSGGAVFALWKYGLSLQNYTCNILGYFITANLLFVWAGVGVNGTYAVRCLYFLALGLWLNFWLVYLTCRNPKMHTLGWRLGKGFVFFALLIWAARTQSTLSAGLMLLTFVAFAAINGGADLFLYKRRERRISLWGVLFPMALMLPLLLHVPADGVGAFALGTALLCVLLGLGAVLAALSGRVTVAALAAGFFLLALFKQQATFETAYLWALWLGLLPVLLVLGVMRWVVPSRFEQADITVFVSALMPYILAFSMAGRMAEQFVLLLGFVLGLNILCLLLAYIYKNGKILPAALAGSALLQLVYIQPSAVVSAPPVFMGFILLLNGVFALAPFVFKRRFLDDRSAWAAAALSGLVCFGVLHITLGRYYQVHNGYLAAMFAVVYAAAVYITACWQPLQEGAQRVRLSWLGGVGLFFLTAFFPLQFSGHWVDMAWALEGAALVWLNRLLNHKGLSRSALALLILVFLRVLFGQTFNLPAGDGFARLLNHYWAVFGIAGASMIYAAKAWLPREETRFSAVLKVMGSVLFFVLMHIEIAVWFTPQPGPLQLEMFGSFQAAIAYTVGWTVFGAVCLFVGFGKKGSGATRVGLALITCALLKLFFCDIWALGGGYRIVGLFGISLVLIGVSFAFQMLRKKQ